MLATAVATEIIHIYRLKSYLRLEVIYKIDGY